MKILIDYSSITLPNTMIVLKHCCHANQNMRGIIFLVNFDRRHPMIILTKIDKIPPKGFEEVFIKIGVHRVVDHFGFGTPYHSVDWRTTGG